MAKIEIKGKTLLIAVVVIAVALLAYFNRNQLFNSSSKTASTINDKNYSAVFLTNGQVYFGVLKNVNSQYVDLTDIYYLQVANQSLQPDKNKNEKTKLELVKLGKELHGPKDEMHINRDHILFWEPLKADGQVVQTIKKNKEAGK